MQARKPAAKRADWVGLAEATASAVGGAKYWPGAGGVGDAGALSGNVD